jgi:hypothetical protein
MLISIVIADAYVKLRSFACGIIIFVARYSREFAGSSLKLSNEMSISIRYLLY